MPRTAAAAGAPHPQPAPPGRARASRGLPPHFSRSPWVSSSSCSNRPGERLGVKAATAPNHIPGASSNPALAHTPDPAARGARLPNAPLPEAGVEAVSAVPSCRRHHRRTALSCSCPVGEWEGWLGGGCYSRLKGEEETETGTAAAAA